MRAFLNRLLFFLLPVVSLAGAMEVHISSIPNNYAYLHQRLLDRRDSIEVLVLGNSHTYRGVDPDGLNVPAINAANPSQDLSIDRMLLEKHIEYAPRLKCVILSVSYSTVGSRMEGGRERWRIKNYILYMDLARLSWKVNDHLELLSRSMAQNVTLILEHAKAGTNIRTCARNGGEPGNPPRTITMQEDGQKAAARHTVKVSGTMETNRHHLESMVSLCAEHNIAVIMVAPPAERSYRTNLEPVQLARSREIPTSIASTKDHVYYLDLLEDPRFRTEDFADSDHLNAKGNDKLTAILSAEVQRVLSGEVQPWAVSLNRCAHSSGSHRP